MERVEGKEMSEIKMTADEAIEFLSTAALTGKKK